MFHAREQYWELRYQKESGNIYGYEPSLSSFFGLINFLRIRAKHILEIGGGTGRNSYLFALYGMWVTNVDTSFTAIKNSSINFPLNNVHNICADILKIKLPQNKFNGVFANAVLPFFNPAELKIILKKCSKCLKNNGIVVFSWLDKKDEYSQKGKYRAGQYIRYYSKSEVKKMFKKYNFGRVEFISCREKELVSGKIRGTRLIISVAKKLK